MTITCIPLFHIRGGSLFFHAGVPCRTPTVPKPERPGSAGKGQSPKSESGTLIILLGSYLDRRTLLTKLSF